MCADCFGMVPSAGGCTRRTEVLAKTDGDGSLQSQPPAGGLGFVRRKLRPGTKGAPLLTAAMDDL